MWLWFGAALAAESVGLDYVRPTRIQLPTSTAGPAPETFEVNGPFRLAGVVDGVRSYEAPNPVRPRALYFERQPLEMELYREGRKLGYTADPLQRGFAGSWEINRDSVIVRLRAELPRPQAGQYTMSYAPATEREGSLRFNGKDDPIEWAVRSAQVDDVTRHGLLLPSPASVTWDVTVDAGAHLRLEAGILPPEVEVGQHSNGATLEVLWGETVLTTVRVQPGGTFAPVDIAIGAEGAGQLTLRTSDDDPTVDHVFLATPRISVPSADPKRVVLAFVDTLRQDHVGTYGYERDTTPKLDAWTEDAVVFENARSVAPWTLPSTRALFTGRQPEFWSESGTLQEALAKRGWATGAYVGNVYLSSNFEMERGWGEHGCLNWPGAAFETGRARDFLRRHEDEDALLMVHFMDLHLPYKEPSRYRHLWAKGDPPGLDPYFNRTLLMRVAMHQRELIRPYLIDRYDQNLRYVDDELSKFFGELGKNATVVLFADHGEEFFDHGDLEHGHTLYDELLRVPLIIKSPDLAARRVAANVTLLDVAPTVLDLLGFGTADLSPQLDGASLVTAAKQGSDPTLENRPVAIGRVLYGPVQWGSVQGASKYTTSRGQEKLFDVGADPSESRDLALEGGDVRPGRIALAQSLGRDVVQAIRVSPTGRMNKEIKIDLQVPGGIAMVWVGDDPTQVTYADATFAGEFVHMLFESKIKEHREVFVVPNAPADDIVGQIGIKILGKMNAFELLKNRPHDGSGTALSRARAGSTAAGVTWAIVPVAGGEAIDGTNHELTSALEALGYTQGNAGEGGDDGAADDRGEPDGERPPEPKSD